jgi:hypothetical protein
MLGSCEEGEGQGGDSWLGRTVVQVGISTGQDSGVRLYYFIDRVGHSFHDIPSGWV